MRGGARKGAGRKSRPTSKSKGIWCGQITDEQRSFIMQWLSPEDRFIALWAASNKACSGQGDTDGKLFHAVLEMVNPNNPSRRKSPRR